MIKKQEINFYHTSKDPISYGCGKLKFSGPKEGFMGLDCWDIAKYALERLNQGLGSFVYLLTIKKLPNEKEFYTERVEVVKIEDQNDTCKEKVVWVLERSAPGTGKYHPVILDYSIITNFKSISKKELEFMVDTE